MQALPGLVILSELDGRVAHVLLSSTGVLWVMPPLLPRLHDAAVDVVIMLQTTQKYVGEERRGEDRADVPCSTTEMNLQKGFPSTLTDTDLI